MLTLVGLHHLAQTLTARSREARNVVNGTNLIRHVKNAAPAEQKYPFGFPEHKVAGCDACTKGRDQC